MQHLRSVALQPQALHDVIVAVPKFNNIVAPCFEVARVFVLATIEGGAVVSTRLVDCGGCEGFGRIQLLQKKKVNALVCSGIKAFYRDLLDASGIAVVSNVSADVTEALEDYIAGRLQPDHTTAEPVDLTDEIPLEDLICWTRELFTVHGYTAHDGADLAPFPIDLIAEIDCPKCDRKVRVAICCGAHSYRPEREIELLHLVAMTGYNARVYVRSATPDIMNRCREYGVELIDPDARFANRDDPVSDRIPILQSIVSGHEAASAGSPELNG